jgi:streptomycin 6-kinase
MHLPEEFALKVKRVWGSDGERWASGFPDALTACVSAWHLTDLTPNPNLSYNFIASARTESGQPVILKMGVPNPELASEVAALQVYDGRGSVRLLAYSPDHSALLLERLSPGMELHQLGNNRQESEIAARLMAQLCIPPPLDFQFPTLQDWTKAFDRVKDNYQPEILGLPVSVIETAQRYAEELTRTTSEGFLLHGDLHHFNILYDQECGWTVIDPKGVVGDKAYQAARFFSNPAPEFLSNPDPFGITRQRVEVIASGLKLNPQRILAWAYVDCILGACWSIEDEGDNPAYFVECARIISHILEN